MNFTTRQVEIINASKELIGEKGLQTLTIKNLAKRMSFSEPALYRHFKDKTEIIKALLLFHKEIIQNGILNILASEKNTLEKFEEILKFKFAHIEKNPALVMVIFSETSFQYNSILSKIVSKILKQRTKKIITIIQSGQDEGSIRKDIDAQQLATIALGGIRTTILSWKLSGFKTDLKSDGKKLWETLKILFKN
ncbi:MAG: TetR/AcrR family transcriptional regulator [Bacteroidota bacterium]|nr:TetR/AcrR family transcriptional regulator [Bacteroidota bacterium]